MDSVESVANDSSSIRGIKRAHAPISIDLTEIDIDDATAEKKKALEELPSAEDELNGRQFVAPRVAHVAPIPVPTVPGLLYIPDFVSNDEETDLMNAIEGGIWDTTLRRRVQHFGLRYDYTSKSVDQSAAIEPLPQFMTAVAKQIEDTTLFSTPPNQCIANEYYPGQGINGHIDRVDSFGPEVASLSLGSDTVMTFTCGQQSVDVLLERKSLVVLSGDSRYKWKHGIAARKTDKYHGRVIPRERRVSLTFRTVPQRKLE